jgi:hypothetical protein
VTDVEAAAIEIAIYVLTEAAIDAVSDNDETSSRLLEASLVLEGMK